MLQAEIARENAALPDVQQHLARVSEDEARHAELAWDFVRWALERSDPELRGLVRAAFRPPPDQERPPRTPDQDVWRAHGLLTPACRWEIERRAWAEVVAPTADALLAGR